MIPHQAGLTRRVSVVMILVPVSGNLQILAECHGGVAVAEAGIVQEVVDKALGKLAGKDWRDRCEGLRSVEAAQSMLCYLPDNSLGQLVDAIISRIGDGNAKVAVQGLEVGQPESSAANKALPCRPVEIDARTLEHTPLNRSGRLDLHICKVE
jgi:hypothetical protein